MHTLYFRRRCTLSPFMGDLQGAVYQVCYWCSLKSADMEMYHITAQPVSFIVLFSCLSLIGLFCCCSLLYLCFQDIISFFPVFSFVFSIKLYSVGIGEFANLTYFSFVSFYAVLNFTHPFFVASKPYPGERAQR